MDDNSTTRPPEYRTLLDIRIHALVMRQRLLEQATPPPSYEGPPGRLEGHVGSSMSRPSPVLSSVGERLVELYDALARAATDLGMYVSSLPSDSPELEVWRTGGMESMVLFNGLTILLTTAKSLETVGHTPLPELILSIRPDELAVLQRYAGMRVAVRKPDGTTDRV